MKYKLEKKVRDIAPVRNAFNALAVQTFQLSFESWYENGYWSQSYLPYTMMDGGTAAANISVNLMKTRWNGQIKSFIQLGTVMTHPAYRGQGLSRYLMEEVFRDWKDRCDGFYLFANKTVLDFYPRFGFQRETEYQCSLPLTPSADGKYGKARRLDMDSPSDRSLLEAHYRMSNPFSLLPSLDNFSLLMFYCGSFLKDCVYYLPDYDAAAVAEQDTESGTLLCHDIFCPPGRSLPEILFCLAPAGTQKAVLGFLPEGISDSHLTPLSNEDDTLFTRIPGENPFHGHRLRFPDLSHA